MGEITYNRKKPQVGLGRNSRGAPAMMAVTGKRGDGSKEGYQPNVV